MGVLYPIRAYFVGIFPYIGLIYGRYLQFRFCQFLGAFFSEWRSCSPKSRSGVGVIRFQKVLGGFLGRVRPVSRLLRCIYIWLVVLTMLENISQWEGLAHILWKIKHVWKCLKPPTSISTIKPSESSYLWTRISCNQQINMSFLLNHRWSIHRKSAATARSPSWASLFSSSESWKWETHLWDIFTTSMGFANHGI